MERPGVIRELGHKRKDPNLEEAVNMLKEGLHLSIRMCALTCTDGGAVDAETAERTTAG